MSAYVSTISFGVKCQECVFELVTLTVAVLKYFDN